MAQESQWQILETADEVANEGLKLTLKIAEESIQANNIFRIVLAGGTTPKNIYKLLANESCEWEKWHLYIGDERCLPENDSERNSQMIKENLLDQIEIPEENIHFMSTEKGAELAAKEYAQELMNVSIFDLVMLGMGEDGHTASLFPGHINDSNDRAHAVYDSPKPPSERVSISADMLSQNNNLLILVTGKSKQLAVKQWQDGEDLPVSRITTLGKKIVLLDRDAT